MKPISVYIHIPFCTIKCGYCDFNAYAGMDAIKGTYRDALVAEARAAAPLLAGREVATLAFGGGTPGEMAAGDLATVINTLRQAGAFAPGAEIGLEANPGTTGREQLTQLREAGVNRISFGAQSFDAAELRFLDRIHSPEAIAASARLAREAGIASVGLDLIYGLPGQTMATWKDSLQRAIALGVDHISCYALTIEEGTPLAYRVARGEVEPADADLVADMYELATDTLAAAGYEQYEISNWAHPGSRSRHNQVYWSDGEYLALGAGAHGYLDGERYENVAHPRLYIERVLTAQAEEARPALLRSYRPSLDTAIFDWVTLALRRLEGFAPEAFERRFGVSLMCVLGEPLREAHAARVLELEPVVRLARSGRLLHGEIAARILAHLDEHAARPALTGG